MSENMTEEERTAEAQLRDLQEAVAQLVGPAGAQREATGAQRTQEICFLARLLHLVKPVLPCICTTIPTEGPRKLRGVYVGHTHYPLALYLGEHFDFTLVDTDKKVVVETMTSVGAIAAGLSIWGLINNLVRSLRMVSLEELATTTAHARARADQLQGLLPLLAEPPKDYGW